MLEDIVPTKESDVFAKLEELDRALSGLEKTSNSLGSRLTVVMQDSVPSDENEAKANVAPRCELSARIAGLIDNVYQQTRYIRSLEKRLEI